jgi:hypothetical protein
MKMAGTQQGLAWPGLQVGVSPGTGINQLWFSALTRVSVDETDSPSCGLSNSVPEDPSNESSESRR